MKPLRAAACIALSVSAVIACGDGGGSDRSSSDCVSTSDGRPLDCDDALAVPRTQYDEDRRARVKRDRASAAQTAIIGRVVALPDALRTYCAKVGASGTRDKSARARLMHMVGELGIALGLKGVDRRRLRQIGADALEVFSAARTTFDVGAAAVKECDPAMEDRLRAILRQTRG
jgi:hypothetical protein